MNRASIAAWAVAGALVAAEAGAQSPSPSPSTPGAPGIARPARPDVAMPSPVEGVAPLGTDRRRPAAPSPDERQRMEASSERRRQSAASGEPDVLLDVPNLSVEEIGLEVQNLEVHLALDARLANLLKLTAGADARIDSVKLLIRGVRAEALLKVRLDNVAAIIDRTLTTIDRNPQILERLLTSVDNTVNTVGGVANTALQPDGVLSQTVNALGQTVTRTLDTTGNIVERTLDTAGRVVNEKTLGSALDAGGSVLSERRNSQGNTVRRVRDQSGAVLELVLDAAGKVVGSRVISAGGGAAGRR